LVEQLPPQSVSDSLPFLTVSVQVGAWQVTLHTPLAQSLGKPQVPPVAQRWQVVAPPQSTSLSLPFLTTSVQLGTWQMLPMQILLVQSLLPPQILPLPHLVAQVPAQSTSVSVPFLVLSVQVAAWHLAGKPEQTPLAQSAPMPHSLPLAQLVGQEPPQSTSVSVPFSARSVQVAA
jgi:hypothetical protein